MPKQKLFIAGFALLLAGFAVAHGSLGEVFTVPSSFAATDNNIAESWSNTMNSFAVKASHALLFVNIAGFLALEFVEYFLRPDLLAGGSIAGAAGPLKSLWIMSRDIMNIIFAMMLIGVAFYTIMSGKSEKIKEHIVHFILAVILVNFSWFFPRIIIDIAHVTTSTIFSIPNVITNQLNVDCKTFDGKDCVILTRATVFPEPGVINSCQPIEQGVSLADIAARKNNGNCQCLRGRDDKSAPICWWVAPYQNGQGDAYTIINALAVNYGRLTSLSQIPKAGAPGAAAQTEYELNFFLNLAFSLFFGIAMVFPFVALAIGLLIRILILWATMAFMPFAFLGFAVKGKLGTDVFGMEDYIWKEFLIAAFLPVLVAVPISIGFVMVLAGVQAPPVRPPNVNFGTPLISGINDWWEFLWAIVAIMIIWTGAFAALRKSKYIGSITDKIQAFGKNIGGTVAKLPLLTPLPTPGGGSVRLGKILAGPKILNTAIDSTILGKGNINENLSTAASGGAPHADEVAKARAALIKPEAQVERDKITRSLNNLTDQTKNVVERTKALEEIRTVLAQKGMRPESLGEKEIIEVLKSIGTDLGLDAAKIQTAERMSTANAINVAPSAVGATHVKIEGNDVDMSQLKDANTVDNVFRSFNIDQNKLNTRAGYQEAISALQNASQHVQDQGLKTKTATMATKLTQMMNTEGNTNNVQEAFKIAAKDV